MEQNDNLMYYKNSIKLKYKFFNVNINRRYITFIFYAYLIADGKFNIENIRFKIDNKNYKNIDLNLYQKKPNSRIKLLLDGNIYRLKFKTSDLIKSNEKINNKVRLSFDIDGINLEYKLAIKDKKIQKKKYYNLPIKSVYTKNNSLQIRRTIGGNLVVVNRKKEPIEDTLRFKILESRVNSFILYYLGKILDRDRIRKKKINIFYEKFSEKAEEGIYELYSKCKLSKESKNYFIIDKESKDYQKIKKDKNVIKKYSIKYYWLIYNASCFIASEVPCHHLNVFRCNNKYLKKAIYDKKFVFLQHGIIYMKNLSINSPFKIGMEGESTYMVVSSEKEKRVVMDMLGYSSEQLLKTGLAMYSNIKYNHINEDSKDIVTIMLTWKPYEEQLYNFEKSSYYKNVIDICNTLKKYISNQNIIIIAHPKSYQLLSNTDLRKSLWDKPISEALEKTKLLITDYSSVCYNSFYQGSGVIFYQPDLEKYEKENGKLIPKDDEYIGKRVFNIIELENLIKQTIKNEKIDLKEIRTQEFEEMYKTINEFSDGKNIDRIYESLIKLKLI